MTRGTDQVDITILGSGISTGILGAILARQGASVMIVDQAPHPKFAIGESTNPLTSQMLSLLGRTYDVPELDRLGLATSTQPFPDLPHTHGIKRVFGFVYHRLGEEARPEEAHQFGNVFRDEVHFFRQDVDAYLFHTALGYGCEARIGQGVSDIAFDDEGVDVTLADGETIRSRFVVDGTGRAGVLARRLGLVNDDPDLTHHSSASFTHMLGVKPFEELAPMGFTNKWSQGTLHHLFEGGWIWVIPFNNWEGSTNPLVSVGLQRDPERWPVQACSPDEEFRQLLAEHLPSAAPQFEDAVAVRPWTRAPRVQHETTAQVGERWALLDHAAGFVDALFSRGLSSTAENISALVPALLEAFEDDDFEVARFDDVRSAHRRNLEGSDRLVRVAYASWKSFELWDRIMRVWAVGIGVTESNLGSKLFMGEHSKIKPLENPLLSVYEDPGYLAFFERCEAAVLDFDAGVTDLDTAVRRLDAAFADYDFEMRLPSRTAVGHEWALKTPGCRDLWVGHPDFHERWARHELDPVV